MDLTTLSLATGIGTVEDAALLVFGGLVAVWGIRKVVKLFNRS